MSSQHLKVILLVEELTIMWYFWTIGQNIIHKRLIYQS